MLIAIRDAIYAVANEALPRVVRRVSADDSIAEDLREESAKSFNFPAALQKKYPEKLREELVQMTRFGVFVVTQKLILYRVLEDSGPRRAGSHTNLTSSKSHEPRLIRKSHQNIARSSVFLSQSVVPKTMRLPFSRSHSLT